MRHFHTQATALALSALLALSPLASASVALGDDLHSGTVGLSQGTNLSRQIFWSNTFSDLRTERYLTYQPNAGVYPMVVYGDKVLSKATLADMAKTLEAQGHRVVGGINGDFYDVATGNPLSIVVSDNVLRSSLGDVGTAVGFQNDGTAFIGRPNLSVNATFSGYTLKVHDVNKVRRSDGGYYLYTEDFSTTTQNTSPGIDVILAPILENLGQPVNVELDISDANGNLDQGTTVPPVETQGVPETPVPTPDPGIPVATPPPVSDPNNPQGIPSVQDPIPVEPTPTEVKATLTQSAQLRIGGRVSCIVEQVVESAGALPIPAGKMVLSINKNSEKWLVSTLGGLKPGDRVELDIASPDTRWNSVTTALGGTYKIVTDGVIGPNIDKQANPRTAVGIKPDGSVVLYTIDGRQSGYSVGANLSQVAQRLIELGCTEALGLDGGGSTIIGATMPGNTSMEILSRPSDGKPRAVSNALFLVTDLKPSGVLDHFYVSPYDALLLSGASVPLKAIAMDSSYYPMNYNGNLSWSIHNGDGIIAADGAFTAGSGKGTTQVTVSDGRTQGTASMTVVQTPDTITVSNQATGTPVTSLSLDPKQLVDLTATSVYKKLPLTSQDLCYTWTADPGAGTVDENGVLTAAEKSGAGIVTVTAGGKSVTIPVNVAGQINALEGFETGTTTLAGTATITVEPETSLDYVRFGKQSARFLYDATEKGTASMATTLTIAPGERYLSMWVYGDNSQNSLTASVADQAGVISDVVLTGLDFTGWKQITAALPENAAALLSISVIYGGGENAATGTLWLDQLTTSNENFTDTVAPTVTTKLVGTALTANVADNVDRKFEAAAISVTWDGKPISSTWDPATGTLKAAVPAADNQLHRLTVLATDHSGNIGRSSVDVSPLSASDIAIPADPGPFADMTTHWALLYTNYLYRAGISTGVATPTGPVFQPEKNITRGEFALMVARWMNLKLPSYSSVELPFSDLASIPAWSLDGMKAMYSLGILKGSMDGGVLVSRASSTITRAEAMTILGRIQPRGYPQATLTFLDSAEVADWALPNVQSLVGQGIIAGFENRLRPNDSVKRSEVAKMLFALQ